MIGLPELANVRQVAQALPQSAAHWREESDPDARRRRQFNRISTHLCDAGRQNSLADLRSAGNILVEDECLIATMGLAEALQTPAQVVNTIESGCRQGDQRKSDPENAKASNTSCLMLST